jgi:NAD+ synthase (glutamine-hydrolysing)
MFEEFTQRHGGAYVHANIKGAIGTRNMYDGICCFTENGKLKELSEPFHLGEVQVTPITININSVRTFRINNKSFQKMSHGAAVIPRVHVDLAIANNSEEYVYDNPIHREDLKRKRATYEFEHASFEPSYFLWDVLRKSKARGYFLAMSGGLDSCAVALIVYNMCYLLYNQINHKPQSKELLGELQKILKDKEYEPESAKEMCGKLLYTVYLATENSSDETKKRSKKIAESFGCNNRQVNFD